MENQNQETSKKENQPSESNASAPGIKFDYVDPVFKLSEFRKPFCGVSIHDAYGLTIERAMELYDEFQLKHDKTILIHGRPETYIAACLDIEFKSRQEMMFFFETVIAYGYSMYIEMKIKPSFTQEIIRLKEKLASASTHLHKDHPYTNPQSGDLPN